MNKKGASKFVNTIILIAFIIALLIIVFLWGKNYLEELAQKRGAIAKKELECQDVKLSIYDFAQTGPGSLSITLENKGTKQLYKFTFRIIGSRKIQPIEITNLDARLGTSQIKKFEDIAFIESDIGELQKVEVIPWLRVVARKYIPCTKQKVTRTVNPS
jgi:hypothetical protein